MGRGLRWKPGIWLLLFFWGPFLGCSSYDWSFPNKVEGYRLAKLIKGRTALREINRLHGKKVEALKGAIAIYMRGGQRAMVWVSLAPSDKVASQQVEVMMEKMERGGPFHHFAMDKVGCLLVYHFLGLGQEHYLFAQDDSVYWISAPVGDGIAFLRVFARKGCPLNP